MQVFVLAIVGCCDLGQQSGDHLDDFSHGHVAYLEAHSHITMTSPRASRRRGPGMDDVVSGQSLNVRQIVNPNILGAVGCETLIKWIPPETL